MVRRIVLLSVVAAVAVMALFTGGCSSELPGVKPDPDAPHKQPMQSMEEKVSHLMVMLELEENLRKNLKGANNLGKLGADAEKALPKLKEVSQNSETDPELKEACLDAIDKINEALDSGTEE